MNTFRPDYQDQQYLDQQPLMDEFQQKTRTLTNPRQQPANFIVQTLQNTDPSNYESFIRQVSFIFFKNS